VIFLSYPMDVTQTTLIDLRDAIVAGEVTAAAATRAYLDRIERLNGRLNAYREVWPELAMQQAEAVDAGQRIGPLAGVPIAVKDVLCTEAGVTACSSKMLEHFQSPFTATAVQKLEAAGAVLLGKTNMDEFAMGSSCENSALGPSRNPWDPQRVPGGSSGGSSAAMAADLCAAALGTDTGGSIRQPAALTGIVGFKPTYGRISRWGLVAFASSLDQIGPMTRTAADAALLTQVMAGHDPNDSTSADVPVPADLADVTHRPRSLRIGIARQYFSDNNDPAVAEATQAAIELYREAGAEIVEVDLPHTEYGVATYTLCANAEASSNLARYDGIHYGHRADQADDLIDLYSRSRSEGFGDEVKRRVMLGTYALSSGYYDAYYLKALKVRRLIKQDFDRAFEQCDTILCPTTTSPAFKIGEKVDDPLAMYLNDVYTVNANLAGIAGVSLPGGFADVGGRRLPVGVQLLGPAFREPELLRIAHQFQAGTDHHLQRPSLSE
jgi:aspartyl-tRNA(Asn)/glutamyl-tRNA(Gln) amidotransferase subunit A